METNNSLTYSQPPFPGDFKVFTLFCTVELKLHVRCKTGPNTE